MTLTSHALTENNAVRDGQYVQIDAGLPWFRSLRLSHIKSLTAKINGIYFVPVEFLFEGVWVPISSLSNFESSEWFVQDLQTLRISTALNQFGLELSFELLMPNLFMGPNTPVVIATTVAGELIVER